MIFVILYLVSAGSALFFFIAAVAVSASAGHYLESMATEQGAAKR